MLKRFYIYAEKFRYMEYANYNSDSDDFICLSPGGKLFLYSCIQQYINLSLFLMSNFCLFLVQLYTVHNL